MKKCEWQNIALYVILLYAAIFSGKNYELQYILQEKTVI